MSSSPGRRTSPRSTSKPAIRSVSSSVLAAALLAAGTFLSASGAEARESIRRFHSHITVHEDGSITVRETIVVRAEGDEIKHGIYRDFPTTYRDRFGHRYVVGFTLQEVLRGSRTEPYHTAAQDNGLRIYVGAPDVVLPPGEYAYLLTYTATRELGFFKDHDELYWNVTGTGWSFPIEQASATVVLPGQPAASDVSLEGYTGPQGSTERDYSASVEADGSLQFQATRPLEPREGLTIVASFPKGLVREPTQAERAVYLVEDNRSLIVGLLGLMSLLAYYLWAWNQVGRDPARGTIVVQYEPPEGRSPAALRYVSRMQFDNEAFTASVINLAVHGAVKIEEVRQVLSSGYKLRRLGP